MIFKFLDCVNFVPQFLTAARKALENGGSNAWQIGNNWEHNLKMIELIGMNEHPLSIRRNSDGPQRSFAFSLNPTGKSRRRPSSPGQLGSLSHLSELLYFSFFLSVEKKNGAPKGKFLAQSAREREREKKRGIIYNTSGWHVPFVSVLICSARI